MNKWEVIHTYRNAGAEGLVDPLLCPLCEQPLTSWVDKYDEPMLKCLHCQTDFPLETKIFDKMVEVLNEAERLR